ncbi:MAG: hypothetical protein COS89_05310, partial [Deltaproteobacteria bacterium CG07_land_8_20_14_0_80_38_7]
MCLGNERDAKNWIIQSIWVMTDILIIEVLMLNKIFKKSLTIVIAAVLLVGARSVFAIQSVGNIDDSYQIESVTRTIDGKLYAWNSKGEQVDNWPIDLSGSGRTFILEPRLMDLDKDGRMEILVISQGADNSMRLHVYTGLARELSKWSRDLSLGESRLVSTPIISDINNDNQLETIYSTNNNQIHVLKEDGNDLDSFTYPETTSFFQIAVAGLFNKGKDQLYAINGSVIFVWDVNPDRSISFLSFFVTPDRGNIIGELVSYDMNADGYNELIFATTNNHIYVVDQNGGVTQSISVVGEMPLSTQIAVGDVNLDGKPDILGLLTNGTRVAYSADGTSLNNWLAEAGYREYSSSSIGKIVDDLYNGAFSSDKGWDLFITYFTNLYNFAVFELGENIHEYDRNTEFYYARAARISNIAAMPLVFTPNGDSVNDQTELHFDLSDNAMITVDLLNSNKQFISNLIHDKEVDKGHVREVWDGINHQGTRTEEDDNPLDSGVYVLRVSARSKQGLISESLTQAVLFGIKAQIEFPEENVQVWQTIAIRGIAADPNIGENSSG